MIHHWRFCRFRSWPSLFPTSTYMRSERMTIFAVVEIRHGWPTGMLRSREMRVSRPG